MDIPPQDDNLKGFGDGFDGFPRRLPDDCVEYIIHIVDTTLQTAAAARTRLNQISKAAGDLQKKFLSDYIWQRESFQLKLLPQSTDGNPASPTSPTQAPVRPHLHGKTHFGDSIADEWLIVYLLFELSKQFSDAWIRIHDTDGEFLLIEAASTLPKWLNPEIAENRVWINNGHLRLIPPKEGSIPNSLSLTGALRFMGEFPGKLVISPFIEDEAFYRLKEYPSAIDKAMHHALVSIPRPLAFILHRNPAYISPAIEAFYLRDPVSVKPLATKDTSNLRFPPEDFVTVSVKFTKVGYAQLRSQVFEPPPAWTGVVPRMKDPKAEMGMKLTCGFEMLLSDPQQADSRFVQKIKLLLQDIESGEESLPSDDYLTARPQTQDDEKWLDIDYNDFEKELSGKSKSTDDYQSKGKGFGDPNAQENLRRMVSRFEDFLNDDEAGADGVDDQDVDDEPISNSDDDDDELDAEAGEDKEGGFSEAEFEQAMKEMMGMPSEQVEKSGLLDEARKLAIEDAEDASEPDEDEDMKKVMELMERELKGHGALDLHGRRAKKGSKAPATTDKAGTTTVDKKVVVFGPERPPHLQDDEDALAKPVESADEEEVGPGEGELSSDDEEYNDVDVGLAQNMLESFKGQAGMAGPAGNLMRSLGVNMPRDEGGGEDD